MTQGDFKVPVITWVCRSRRYDDVWSARSVRNEAPVDAGDRSSRLHRPELRCAVSLPPSV